MLFRNLFNDKIAQIQNLFGLFFLKTFHKKYYKTKSAATEVTAQKTQTPIVAKLTNVKRGVNALTYTHSRNLHFYQIQYYEYKQK